jgi:ribose 5-phosphate isomerase RpiB
MKIAIGADHALDVEAEEVRLTRAHIDANVPTLGVRLSPPETATRAVTSGRSIKSHKWKIIND